MKVKPDGDGFTTTISCRCSKLTKPASGKDLSMILKKEAINQWTKIINVYLNEKGKEKKNVSI